MYFMKRGNEIIEALAVSHDVADWDYSPIVTQEGTS